MSFSKLKNFFLTTWKENKIALIVFGLLLVGAAFLRLYKLEEFITFLGDQGRDAIIIRRIVTGEDFPGIGPRSSIGQLFLGPFFFYIMAPFLALFNFNPVGLAFGVAFLSLVSIVAGFFIVKKEYNIWSALAFVIFTALSYATVSLSRFSWNPNLLPVFSFFSLYFFYKLLTEKHIAYPLLFGFFLSGALQLHYLMLLVLPAFLVTLVFYLVHNKKQWVNVMKKLGISIISFGITYAPFILFDIKNRFLNLKGLLGIFTEKQFQGESTYLDHFYNTNINLLQYVFQVEKVPVFLGVAVFIALVALTIWLCMKKKNIQYLMILNLFALISFILLFSVVDIARYLHYYTPVYYSFFLVIAAIPYFMNRIAGKVIIGAIVGIFLFTNLPTFSFLQKEGNFQTHIAERIAQKIVDNLQKTPYYLASVPLFNTNHHIRYYLEVKGKRPLAEESTEYAEELFVLCYDKDCKPTEDPQYQVVVFGDKRIAKEVKDPEVTIYRVIHAK